MSALNMKKVIYTAIFGDYDDLKEPKIVSKDWDYVCFTNQDLKSDTWEIVQVESDKPNHILCREFWIYPYEYLKGYDIAFAVSGKIKIYCDLNEYIKDNYTENMFSLLKHPDRDCVYLEGLECALRNKDSWFSIFKTLEFYKSMGMPRKDGLLATCISIRDLNDYNTKQFCELWLQEFKRYSFRDQLSLAFSVWKYKFYNKIKLINYNDLMCNQFELIKHK